MGNYDKYQLRGLLISPPYPAMLQEYIDALPPTDKAKAEGEKKCFEETKVKSGYTADSAADECLGLVTNGQPNPPPVPPVPPTAPIKHDDLEKGAGIVKLRDYIKAKRGDDDKPITPNDVLQKEIGDFEKFYQEWRPSVPSDDLKDFDEEFQFLKKSGLSRDTTPSYPNAYQITAMGSGGATLVWKAYTWIAKDPADWDLHIPLGATSLMTSRLTGKSPTPISPFEYKQKSLWDTTSSALFMGVLLLPLGHPKSSDTPTAAGELGYTDTPEVLGGFHLPNDTFKWVISDQLMQKLKADSFQTLALNQLDTADKPMFGIKPLDISLKAGLATASIMYMSGRMQRYSDVIDRSHQLEVGDGTQCTAASAAEITAYRQKNPGTTKTDDEILKDLCDNKPLGSNEGLYAPKRANDLLTLNNYIDAYGTWAFNRDIALLSIDETYGPLTAAGFALLQPVINQLPTIKNGINKGQLGRDYAVEGGAAAMTLLSYGHPELRVPLARTFDLWTDAFFLPEAYLRVGPFMNRDEPNNKIAGFIPSTLPDLIAVDGLTNGIKNYFSGVEAGDMFARALKTNDTVDKLQLMSPLILGIGAHIARKVKLGTLLAPKYAEKITTMPLIFEIADPVLYATGSLVGALTSDHQDDATTAFGAGVNGGMLGGNFLGANDKPILQWNLNVGLGNATLGGSF